MLAHSRAATSTAAALPARQRRLACSAHEGGLPIMQCVLLDIRPVCALSIATCYTHADNACAVAIGPSPGPSETNQHVRFEQSASAASGAISS